MCLGMFHQLKCSQTTLRNSGIKNLRREVRISNWIFLLLLVAYSNHASRKPCLIELFSHAKLWHFVVLLQHGAEPTIRNTDGRTALDLADPSAKAVLTGK